MRDKTISVVKSVEQAIIQDQNQEQCYLLYFDVFPTPLPTWTHPAPVRTKQNLKHVSAAPHTVAKSL